MYTRLQCLELIHATRVYIQVRLWQKPGDYNGDDDGQIRALKVVQKGMTEN